MGTEVSALVINIPGNIMVIHRDQLKGSWEMVIDCYNLYSLTAITTAVAGFFFVLPILTSLFILTSFMIFTFVVGPTAAIRPTAAILLTGDLCPRSRLVKGFHEAAQVQSKHAYQQYGCIEFHFSASITIPCD